MLARKIILFIVGLSFTGWGYAQELNCQVVVNATQVQSSDKKIFETLQTSLTEFMNNRRWTNDQYLNQERIDCSIFINVSERSNDEFKATIEVQSRRPVYRSSYFTPIFKYQDNDFNFKYLEFQQLEFIENTYQNNLTSVLAFYAYMLIGYDYDTFSLEGGTPFYLKAQAVVNNAQNATEVGWKAYENTRNRYWLVENALNPLFKAERETFFKYHRQGLDNMTDNKENARAAITESIELLKKVFAEKPGSLWLQLFFTAKADEIINIYSQAYTEEKNRIINTLTVIDPSNGTKYQDILKSQ